MSYTVYGIRLKGEREARYIGQTSGKPGTRLSSLQCGGGLVFRKWLSDNRENLETFAIAYADTRVEAVAIEQVAVAFCLRLNHRLFNREHVPVHLRLVENDDLDAAA